MNYIHHSLNEPKKSNLFIINNGERMCHRGTFLNSLTTIFRSIFKNKLWLSVMEDIKINVYLNTIWMIIMNIMYIWTPKNCGYWCL